VGCVLVDRGDPLEILSHLLEQLAEPQVFLTEFVGQRVGWHREGRLARPLLFRAATFVVLLRDPEGWVKRRLRGFLPGCVYGFTVARTRASGPTAGHESVSVGVGG